MQLARHGDGDGAIAFGQDERELVAAVADGDLGLRQRRGQRHADGAQELVAHGRAVALVEGREAVDVEKNDGQRPVVALRPHYLLRERVFEVATVAQPGDFVDFAEATRLLLVQAGLERQRAMAGEQLEHLDVDVFMVEHEGHEADEAPRSSPAAPSPAS